MKSQVDYRLYPQQMLRMNVEDKDICWEYCMVVEYCKEKGDDHSANHKCLVGWKDINKTTSWMNFTLSLSNPKPIIYLQGTVTT
jgi:hypothetical protein